MPIARLLRRGIAAYGAGFLLGVVLSVLWAEGTEATAFTKTDVR
jgi:hypothetical protein